MGFVGDGEGVYLEHPCRGDGCRGSGNASCTPLPTFQYVVSGFMSRVDCFRVFACQIELLISHICELFGCANE